MSPDACEECGKPFEYRRGQRMSLRFCSDRCRYRNRDRRRYSEDPEGQRAKARAYYAANREKVLQRARSRRAGR